MVNVWFSSPRSFDEVCVTDLASRVKDVHALRVTFLLEITSADPCGSRSGRWFRVVLVARCPTTMG